MTRGWHRAFWAPLASIRITRTRATSSSGASAHRSASHPTKHADTTCLEKNTQGHGRDQPSLGGGDSGKRGRGKRGKRERERDGWMDDKAGISLGRPPLCLKAAQPDNIHLVLSVASQDVRETGVGAHKHAEDQEAMQNSCRCSPIVGRPKYRPCYWSSSPTDSADSSEWIWIKLRCDTKLAHFFPCIFRSSLVMPPDQALCATHDKMRHTVSCVVRVP